MFRYMCSFGWRWRNRWDLDLYSLEERDPWDLDPNSSEELDLRWSFRYFSRRTEIEDEYFQMKSDMKNEYFKMISDLKKKISSTLKFEFCNIKSYIDDKFFKMSSDIKEEFFRMSFEIDHKFSKMSSDMKEKVYWMSLEMINRIFKVKFGIEKKISKMRLKMKNDFSSVRSFMKKEISRIITVIIFDAGDSDVDTKGRRMAIGKQPVKVTFLIIGTLVFASTFCPCAGETEIIKSGQRQNQKHSQIYESSLAIVFKCPNSSEYTYKTLEKCANVCGNSIQDGSCAYHCMRDSSKTKLVECCAKPKILFEYCPEFDPVHQTIQKDQTTLCNSQFPRNYYNSSDIYFCDPNSCLQLYDPSDFSGTTGLTTLMNGTTEKNGGDNQQVQSFRIWFLTLMLVAVVIAVAFVIICILCKFGIISARPRDKDNPADVEKRIKKPLMVKM